MPASSDTSKTSVCALSFLECNVAKQLQTFQQDAMTQEALKILRKKPELVGGNTACSHKRHAHARGDQEEVCQPSSLLCRLQQAAAPPLPERDLADLGAGRDPRAHHQRAGEQNGGPIFKALFQLAMAANMKEKIPANTKEKEEFTTNRKSRYTGCGKRLGEVLIVEGHVAWQTSGCYTVLPAYAGDASDQAARQQHGYTEIKPIGGVTKELPKHIHATGEWILHPNWSETECQLTWPDEVVNWKCGNAFKSTGFLKWTSTEIAKVAQTDAVLEVAKAGEGSDSEQESHLTPQRPAKRQAFPGAASKKAKVSNSF